MLSFHTDLFNKGKVKDLSLGRNNSMHQLGLPGSHPARKQLDRKGLWCPGGHQVEHESEMCTCCKEG